jgi:phenylalanyl-tRNA synthetase beta chain
VDPAPTAQYVERITRLILEICGGQAGPLDDQTLKAAERKDVTLRLSRAQRVIGMPVTLVDCQTVFQRLGLSYGTQAHGEDSHLVVTPPSWRFDLQVEEDLIEEVVRVIGFDKLPKRAPKAPVVSEVRPEKQRSLYAVRRSVAAAATRKPSPSALCRSAGKPTLPATPSPSVCSTRSPARCR